VLEDLEARELEYVIVGEFLVDLKEFGRGDNKIIKVVELKRIEQGNKIMEKFVQEFRRAVRRSRYERRPLMKEFKQGVNRVIRRKLIEVERPPRSIK